MNSLCKTDPAAYDRWLRAFRKSIGQCSRCRSKTRPGKTTCQACSDKMKNRYYSQKLVKVC